MLVIINNHHKNIHNKNEDVPKSYDFDTSSFILILNLLGLKLFHPADALPRIPTKIVRAKIVHIIIVCIKIRTKIKVLTIL